MIKLVLLAPCEKLIIGQDNNTSLIAVLEHVQVNGQLITELPPNAGIPFRWSATALWHRTESVPEPISVNAKFELANPAGEVYMGADATFDVSDAHINFRNVVEFPVFPIATAGIYWLKLSYKKTDEEVFTLAGEYPIRLIHAMERSNALDATAPEAQPVI